MIGSVEPALKAADTLSKLIPRHELSPKDANDLLNSLLEELERTEPRRIRVEMLTRLLWKSPLSPDLSKRVFALPQEPGTTVEDVIRWVRISQKHWTWKGGRVVLKRSLMFLCVKYWTLAAFGCGLSIFGVLFYFKLQSWASALRAANHPLHWSSALILLLLDVSIIGFGMVPFAWAGHITIAKKLKKLLKPEKPATISIHETEAAR